MVIEVNPAIVNCFKRFFRSGLHAPQATQHPPHLTHIPVIPADDLCPLGNHGSGQLGEGVGPVIAVFCRDFCDVM